MGTYYYYENLEEKTSWEEKKFKDLTIEDIRNLYEIAKVGINFIINLNIPGAFLYYYFKYILEVEDLKIISEYDEEFDKLISMKDKCGKEIWRLIL